MGEFKEAIENNPKTQEDIKLFAIKYCNQSCRRQTQIGQKAKIRERTHEKFGEINVWDYWGYRQKNSS